MTLSYFGQVFAPVVISLKYRYLGNRGIDR
jgi:hypothetical protein